jgi:hypothetical protein
MSTPMMAIRSANLDMTGKTAAQTENALCVLAVYKICDHCSTGVLVKLSTLRGLIHFEKCTSDFQIPAVSA